MLRSIVFAVAGFFLSVFAIARQQRPADMKDIALADLKNGKLRYYAFGFAGPSKELLAKAKKLGITVVSQGCVMDEDLARYNQVADSIFAVRSKNTKP